MVADSRSTNSLVVFRNSQGADARGTLLKLTRTTLIFEVYNPYSIVQLSEVLQDVQIRRGERVVYRGRGIVSNLVNTGLMLIVSANLLDGWSDLSGVLAQGDDVHREVTQFIADWDVSYRLGAGYQVVVARLRSLLTELHRWLEQIEPIRSDLNTSEMPGISQQQFQELAEVLLPRLNALFQEFEDEAAKVRQEEVVNHKRFAQHDLHPLILRAPFVHRAYYKPLGYAGDYEMVKMMLQSPREGPTIYSQLINTLYLQAGPAEAHRNRIDILVKWLKQKFERANTQSRPLRVLNVGCGPAIEIQRLLDEGQLQCQCRFEMMDFNEETLNYTRSRIEEMNHASSGIQFEFVHQSVHLLLKKAARTRERSDAESYDLIYCAGLFDYLSDKICARLVQLFYYWLLPQGQILVTNVHPNNANRWAMEFLLEWHLVYRDEQRMAQLTPHLGRQSIFTDKTDINVFLEVEKPAL